MNKLPTLFAGFFATFVFAWLGLVAAPYLQIGRLAAHTDEDTGDSFPAVRTGLAELGKEVYQANGCIYCHSQQIRPEHQGADIARGWGQRRSVARDYIYDKPHLMGTMRTGPDLTNVGRRLSNRQWHHEHLYAPRAKSEWSTMPSFKHLYVKQRISGRPSANALINIGDEAPEEGYEIVPTAEADALVEYLLSLNRDYSLPEAPIADE